MACGWFSVTGWWTLLRQHLPSLAGCLRSTCADDADWKHLHYFFCLHGALSGGQVGQVTQTNLIVCVPWGLWNKEHFFLLLENWIINSHIFQDYSLNVQVIPVEVFVDWLHKLVPALQYHRSTQNSWQRSRTKLNKHNFLLCMWNILKILKNGKDNLSDFSI